MGAPTAERRGGRGTFRALVLAVAVHAAFFALIVFGVSWQSREAPPVQAELWEKLPPPKASPPVEVPPPIEKPAAAAKPVELKPPPQVRRDPEAEIQEKLEREKREREREERIEKQKAAEAKKRQEEEARKREEEAKRRKEEARQKAEAERKRREEEKARAEAEKAREAAAAARRSEIAGYMDRIRAKIRGRANVPDTVRGNPEVHVLIRVLPGGGVLDSRITRSSGNPAYDSAIERAIRSASPLPVPPADSELFPQFRELKLEFRHER